MTKLQQAIDIVNKRLPSSYLSEFKIFKNCSQMIRWYCKDSNKNYEEMIQWYTDYIESPKTCTYINTKYYPIYPRRKTKRQVFRISAISYKPIILARNNIEFRKVSEIVHLLIHELGHHYLKRKRRNDLDERWCDLFAIRWIRKMTKEGIFND